MKYRFKEGKGIEDIINIYGKWEISLYKDEIQSLYKKDYLSFINYAKEEFDEDYAIEILDLFEEVDPFEQKWEEIEKNFDWERVEKVMNFLDWKWYTVDGIPNIRDLKHKAYNLLKEAYDNGGYYAVGGFTAEYITKDNFLQLSFVLDSWDS